MVSVQRYMKNREELRNIGRNFPIDFDERNEEAIDYIDNIRIAIEELKAEYPNGERFNEQLVSEFAEGTVPYNDYKAANAFTQLGLYKEDGVDSLRYEGDQRDIMVIMRSALFYKSEEVIRSIMEDRFD